MSRIGANFRTMLVLLVAPVVAGVLLHQEMEIRRLRMAIAKLSNINSEGTPALSMATTLASADIEELYREAAEVPQLRAEITQLKLETSALQVSIDKLAAQASDVPGTFNRMSAPVEVARWVATLPSGQEQNE